MRFGFIEPAASWVLYPLRVYRGAEPRKKMQPDDYEASLPVGTELSERPNLFVVYESHEDLPRLLQFGLERWLRYGPTHPRGPVLEDSAGQLCRTARAQLRDSNVVRRQYVRHKSWRFDGL